MLLALSGCSSPHPVANAPADRSAPSAPAPGPTFTQIVHNARSTLYAAVVRPGPEGYTITAWWTLRRGDKVLGAIVTSDDRFETAHYEKGSWARWAKYQAPARKDRGPSIAAFKGLLASPVKSLEPGTRAFVAGGDGATLLPFQVVARSTDGVTWRAYRVPKTRGDQAYDEGDLVLADGRFLVLLDAWSSDRRRKPGPEYHGLWISRGDDWAHYLPYRPVFVPALGASASISEIWAQPGVSRRAPQGLVVAIVGTNALYVSTDGAKTFHRLRAR